MHQRLGEIKEMLIVEVRVNRKIVALVTARRIKGTTKPNSVNKYLINEGDLEIDHRYGDGAIALAEKIIPYAYLVD